MNRKFMIPFMTTTALSLTGCAAFAQSGEMLELPPLPGQTDSGASAVNDAGNIVVGRSGGGFLLGALTLGLPTQWTVNGDVRSTEIPVPFVGARDSNPYAISGDGQTVVGFSQVGVEGFRAFRTKQNGTTEDLGTLGGRIAAAYGVSRNGEVVVGVSETGELAESPLDFTSDITEAFIWTADSGMRSLGRLDGPDPFFSIATDVSKDGATVVGASGRERAAKAFLWREDTGMQALGTLSDDPAGPSFAWATDADGSVIVGWASRSFDRDAFEQRAFRWNEATGAMQDLGTLKADGSGYSEAYDVNDDGTVVVGGAENDTGDIRAFRWTTYGGMKDLGTLRDDNEGEARAYGVNDDGFIVVGQAENDDGDLRAFIWRADVMIDHINTLEQVAENAQRQAVATTVLANTVQFVLGQEITPPAPAPQVTQGAQARTGRPPVAVRVSVAAGQNADGADVALAGLTAAVGLGDGYNLGGYLAAGGDTSDLASFGYDGTIVDAGVYLRKRPAGGTGLTWRLAAARSGGDVTITRPGDLTNTERAEGDSSVETIGASVEIGYSLDWRGARLTPFGRLTYTEATRDGYTESNNAAFPVTYDEYSYDATFASVGLDADIAVGARGTVSLSGGLEIDIDRSDDPVTGTSDIPFMTQFSIDGPDVKNDNRAFASARYQYALNARSNIDVGLGARQSAYSDEATVLASIGYQVNF